MTMHRLTVFILLLVLFSFTRISSAMTVYMKDGSEIEAQSAWKKGEKVYIRVSPDLRLEFPASEVNLGKSGIVTASLERKRRTVMVSEASAPASYRQLHSRTRRKDPQKMPQAEARQPGACLAAHMVQKPARVKDRGGRFGLGFQQTGTNLDLCGDR
jgi:hypothetical protein